MKKEEGIFALLKEVAKNSPRVSNARMAAAIVYKSNVIAVGTNQYKTHPFQAEFGTNEECVYWHAENRAIHDARKQLSDRRLSKCDLYVLRINQAEEHCMARPCDGCMKTIERFGLRTVYYTVDNAFDSNSFYAEML